MPLILIGSGSAMCILVVPKVPEIGDKIRVRESMIKWALTANAYFMIGNTYKVTDRGQDYDTQTEEFGVLPHFSLSLV